ncbi:MAG: DsrE family protein [Rhizobiales bacterium]|nr:DsrE family protein [Hyphomicrobiales bacterium]
MTPRSLFLAACLGLGLAQPLAAGELSRPVYSPQKVVYQVNADGGLLSREYRRILATATNHVNAVGPVSLDLRIVLQGDGLGLLRAANGDERLREQIDWLRERNVRFLICRNTVASQKLDLLHDLYGAKESDVVIAGVAEIAALEQEGFVYVRP